MPTDRQSVESKDEEIRDVHLLQLDQPLIIPFIIHILPILQRRINIIRISPEIRSRHRSPNNLNHPLQKVVPVVVRIRKLRVDRGRVQLQDEEGVPEWEGCGVGREGVDGAVGAAVELDLEEPGEGARG